ncbi:MAG TPA: LPS export ABC transporter periplasmic protein LptC [Rubrivivax sp.]|nr:LPS export ABC transporter periplasmic protein LptC [Rubrivivax sp.]HOW49785.1 LPS export ABC transporter periplasmic protein LptC [Rubrivivax sp.]HRY88946.1 LPS export ABC transporter periplasmic protein LptC [Rubrivivax sp.]HRZ62420.1 LPS export ABC transporter periplasmic protein LptC [Rubrivivax sp.]
MALELHLPDLPEVPIGLGQVPAPAPRPPQPWHQRLRERVAIYLPLLLMGLLALASWWLVKSTPRVELPRAAEPPSSEPDYTMNRFVVERFDAQGRLTARIEGRQLRHYPDVDRIEVDDARVRVVGKGGRPTLAQARLAISNGDGSELQLLGDARIDGSDAQGRPVAFRGEFLHLYTRTERVKSHLPVLVSSGGSEFRAAGLDYDHLGGLLQLQGPIRALLQPQDLQRRAPANAAASTPKDPR